MKYYTLSKYIVVVTICIMSMVALAPTVSRAQLPNSLVEPCNQLVNEDGEFVDTEGNPAKCDFEFFVANIQRIITWLLAFAVTVAVVLFTYAGILYVTAAGNETQIQKAHSVFKYTISGFILALVAWLVVNTIVSTFVDKEGYTLLGS